MTELDHSNCNRGDYRHACVHGDSEKCPECWDPWDELGIHCAGYNSRVDLEAIMVLRGINAKMFNSDIARASGMTESHVELLQYIFCSHNWCDYGTSPRGCFPEYKLDFDALIAKWENYYRLRWDEEPVIDPPATHHPDCRFTTCTGCNVQPGEMVEP